MRNDYAYVDPDHIYTDTGTNRPRREIKILTQTAERQELQRVIDALPEEGIVAMLGFVKSLRSTMETTEWVDPIETGKRNR